MLREYAAQARRWPVDTKCAESVNRMASKSNKMPKITLRPAQPLDHDFAAGLYLESRKELLTTLGMWDEVRVKARFDKVFKPDQAQVIRSDGVDIGWMQISEGDRGFHLHQLYLVDRYRNRGIGRALVEALQDRARGIGKPIALNVIRGNPAMSLYRRLGFRLVGEDEEKLHLRWSPDKPKAG